MFKLYCVAMLLILLAVVTAPGLAQDPERTVPVHQEPRHRMVFEAGSTRILHAQVHPGDMSLWHTHAEPMLYISFGAATEIRTQDRGASWSAPVKIFPTAPPSRVLSNTTYAEQPLTHRIQNVGKNVLELILVLNSSAGDKARTPRDAGFEGEPELTNRWYRVYRFTVAPDQSARHTHETPVVVVQTSAGAATGIGNRVFGFNRPTSWGYFDADEAHELRNRADTPIAFVEVEVRQPQ
jgi:hypothetical protein